MTTPLSRAENLPLVPSKILPSPRGGPVKAPARVHTSPIADRTFVIRQVPKEFDSDAEQADEIARDKALAEAPAPGGAAAAAAPAAARIPWSEFSSGSDRKAAKLSIASGPAQPFDDLRD